MKNDTSLYEHLLIEFLDGRMALEVYAQSFMDAFKAEKRFFDQPTYEVLNRLFTEIDVFDPDADHRLEWQIGLEELVASAQDGLAWLRRPD